MRISDWSSDVCSSDPLRNAEIASECMAQIRHARLRHSAHDSGERQRAVARDIFEQRKFAEVKTLEFAHAFSVPLGNGRQAELWSGRIRRHNKESAARADAFCKAGEDRKGTRQKSSH